MSLNGFLCEVTLADFLYLYHLDRYCFGLIQSVNGHSLLHH